MSNLTDPNTGNNDNGSYVGMGPNGDGWHTVDIRFNNGGGGAGAINVAGFGANGNGNGTYTNMGFGYLTSIPSNTGNPVAGGRLQHPDRPR